MSVNFPANPSLNDTYSIGLKSWKYNGTAWDAVAVTATGPTGPTGAAIAALNTVTGTSYALVITDAFNMIEVDASTAFTITVPTDAAAAFADLTEIHIVQAGTGQITVTGSSGVTVQATPSRKFRAQWSVATLIKRSTDSWLLTGDLEL